MTSSRWKEIPDRLKSRVVGGGTGGRVVGAKLKAKRKTKAKQSEGEITFANQVHLAGLPDPEHEHRFALPRRWRFDFAWPSHMIAVEIEGGAFTQGRHTRGKGFEADCVKYCEAVLLGWRLLRFTTKQVDSGLALETVERAFKK